jgi:hypothetical protein
MRKLFWCSVGVAVAAAGSVYLASKSVEQSPAVLVGQALVNAAGEDALGGGLKVAGAHVGLPEPPTAVEMIDTPVEEVPQPSEVVAVAHPSTPGHISIEGEGVSAAFAPVLLQANVVQTPPAPAPALMPYCGDDEEGGPRRMPYASEEEECECPQPQTAKEGEAWELLRRAAREAAEELPLAEQEPGEEAQDLCPDNTSRGTPGHHDHDMVCPYTGQSYPRYPVCPSAPEAPEEMKPKKDNNEKKTPTLRESRKTTPPEVDVEQSWPTFRIDTMEFRPSDAGFQPILPRPF